MMPASIAHDPGYGARLVSVSGRALSQLVRPPSHSRRAQAARRAALASLWLSAAGAVIVIALMMVLDATEIQLMPARGTPGLWPIKFLTDFGKDEYVLSALAAALIAVALLAAARRGIERALLLALGTRLQFIFFSVLLAVGVAELLKFLIGRGRPFVGGAANAFNFAPFNGTEAYYSLPSAHAVTAFALAFAVSAVWPRLRLVMFTYAVVIAVTRLVLLAHHPSDVVAGGLVGILAAMAVRYWFAARRLGFAIQRDGTIVPLPGPVFSRLKRVAREASGP
jgi:membrane-associated phospholipid phosphatase